MLEKLPDAIGHALRNRRAGLENIAFNLIDLRAGTAAIEVSSLAFNDHAPIPEQYTADGAGTSPPLEWTGIPAGAASLLLIVEDADAPTPHPLVHAIAVDLAPHDGSLPEGALMGAEPDAVLKLGRNSYLQASWLPPDPPPGHGIHRYA
ncbi:MAG: phosphatidylethanolamine-binding protein, partial [Noviherbaspirillum sp.]|nr:phosphatidylethanolamine-binding protein [Noviherbaspirillum sp.]